MVSDFGNAGGACGGVLYAVVCVRVRKSLGGETGEYADRRSLYMDERRYRVEGETENGALQRMTVDRIRQILPET